MEMLLRNEDRKRIAEEETQPNMTQLQYIDNDAADAREMVMERLGVGEGEEGVKRRRGGREKAVTIGDLLGPGGGGTGKRVTRKSAGRAGR